MGLLLKPNQTIVYTASAKLGCQVKELLGSGAQGAVYRAVAGDKEIAIKWYWPAAVTPAQRALLEDLVRLSPPNERFLWPIDLVHAPSIPGFGFAMPLRHPRFKGLVDLMTRRVAPSLHALSMTGLQLADSFFQLHALGRCYRDISFGNVFFDPDTGDVLICDVDNVAIDGAEPGGILGTPRFMAPEVVRGAARPSTNTDLYSLAVLLFYLFIMNHPLEGRREAAIHCLDTPAMQRLYGTQPIFIYDPRDASNRPQRGYHDNALVMWPLYPAFLRDLFTRAFTRGLHNPQQRVRETEWRQALADLLDTIVYCARCGSENFYDSDARRAPGGPGPACWDCGCSLRLPPQIRIDRHNRQHIVVLNHNQVLYPHHLAPAPTYDFSRPVAAVVQHPTAAGLWGLKNLSPQPWTCASPAGRVQPVDTGQSVSLTQGTTIHFGDVTGVIMV